ncbi:serine/threonine protein kinase [Candidatus Venteria ishoeyi]|uniref:Serine/threonine-protein kinase PrkC n=1 Tax=Candidatus Venteria ishoeyi TaxID=1899563 RepID=A0A1H6FBI0_9GAMM|nr:serine/threonine-protein kinase [Candidatus Venteria ishoeyi]SEH07437.1 Serine/threonine-protein kinase PrkC [Candidatus Venteria ishoeyi]
MSDKPVTQRYQQPATPLTQRYPATQAVTQHYVPEAEVAVHAKTRKDLLIAQRYAVKDGPLGACSGEAEVYLCQDRVAAREVAVKLYHDHAMPKTSIMDTLKQLQHPNVVRLYEYGKWQARFYEVMEFCAGGVMADFMPLSEEDIRAYLPGILDGLSHCHQQGIIHRDIKPNNLFFLTPQRQTVLLGDFGISSYLDRGNQIRMTQSASHLTLDYAAPELIDGHEVSPKTDYYGLGITLMHLLAGHSPFHDKSQNDILVAHLRGRLPIPEKLSLDFQNLLRGLTLPKPEARWAYAEVLAWQRGECVPLNLDSYATTTAEAVTTQPYPGYPQASTPLELAQSLEYFKAYNQLMRGDIRRWVFDHVSQSMAEAIEKIVVGYRDKPEQALCKLYYTLAPQSPLQIARHKLENLRQFADLLNIALQDREQGADTDLVQAIESALWQERIETWLLAGKHAGNRSQELVDKLSSLRKRLQYKQPETALFALLYTLDPKRPLVIVPGVEIQQPKDLKILFQQHKKVTEKFLKTSLYNKYFEEWLRAAAFPNWQQDVAFIEETRRMYLDKPQLGIYSLLWRYYPDLPLPFAGHKVTQITELAHLIDASHESRHAGLKLLKTGWLRTWLVATQKVSSVAKLDHALLAVDVSLESKLEALLQLLDPNLAQPQLQVKPTHLNFGSLFHDEISSETLQIKNISRGFLNGEITLEHYGEGITLDKYLIEGNHLCFEITLEPLAKLSPGVHQNSLHIHSNGGEQVIPIRFILRKTPQEPLPWWRKIFS